MNYISEKEIFVNLKQAGLKLTKQRKAIIHYIAGRTDHPTAQQIYHQLRSRDTDLSMATVYNTLNVLVTMALIKEIDFEHSDNRYDTNLNPHINLICTSCGSISDHMTDLPISPRLLKQKHGFTLKNYRLEYQGLCASCQELEQPAAD